MQHNWPCDNCGTVFYTFCFGPDIGGTVYCTPVRPALPRDTDAGDLSKDEVKDLADRIRAYSCTAVTALCDICINQ